MNRPITNWFPNKSFSCCIYYKLIIIFTYTNKYIWVCRVCPHGRQRIKSTANRRWWIKKDPLHTGVESCVETNWSWWETQTRLDFLQDFFNPYWTTLLTRTALSAVWRFERKRLFLVFTGWIDSFCGWTVFIWEITVSIFNDFRQETAYGFISI